MGRLETLIYSLSTVIVLYHDHQSGVPKLITESDPYVPGKKFPGPAMEIIKHESIDDHLKNLIDECTKGHSDRKHFLFYLSHEIQYLKKQLDRTTSYEKTELKEYQRQVTELFTHLILLLQTKKGSTCSIKYSKFKMEDPETNLDLPGVLTVSYLGNTSFCRSGSLLIQEILGRFNLTESCTPEEVSEISRDLCMEHQNALSAQEKEQIQAELVELKLELGKKASEITALQNECDDLKKTKKPSSTLTIRKLPPESVRQIQTQVHKPPYDKTGFFPSINVPESPPVLTSSNNLTPSTSSPWWTAKS